VVIPIGLLGVLASLQNIESAAAAGDNYPVRPSLVINGLGTIAPVTPCSTVSGSRWSA
jgi:AGZA family xanthine/uracil permease-like MFS transporter